ncbi:UNVERIFIED_CONTAM: protein LIKE COV 2 [Sesamum latifolium]|uniref:Protein LIKE COV 2 n=1 Tax=Sesamum latifolium TaxID=2727402 RepID=A0AAW2X6E6_9LAMI
MWRNVTSHDVVLFPVAVTFFVTWWFIQFVDGFFSPLYAQLGVDIFGLGFVTSLVFVFLVGVFVSSWLGATVFWIGEWFIKRMPLSGIFTQPPSKSVLQFLLLGIASPKYFMGFILLAPVSTLSVVEKSFTQKLSLLCMALQVLLTLGFDQNNTAFKEVAIIRHPRVGEYAFGFITSTVLLQRDDGDEELCSVFVPTNHLYIGDIFLVNSKDIIRPNLSIREGIGMYGGCFGMIGEVIGVNGGGGSHGGVGESSIGLEKQGFFLVGRVLTSRVYQFEFVRNTLMPAIKTVKGMEISDTREGRIIFKFNFGLLGHIDRRSERRGSDDGRQAMQSSALGMSMVGREVREQPPKRGATTFIHSSTSPFRPQQLKDEEKSPSAMSSQVPTS